MITILWHFSAIGTGIGTEKESEKESFSDLQYLITPTGRNAIHDS